ncbi:MAG: hypothetical protein R2845_01410 [Thermomicrobiales bacterium]
MLTAQETLDSIEQDIYARLVREIAGHATSLLAAAQSVATLDLLAGLADVASARRAMCGRCSTKAAPSIFMADATRPSKR